MRLLKSALLVFARRHRRGRAVDRTRRLSDTRLTVHTLLREDIFAGFQSNNMDRVSKAEQNIETLLQERPDQRAQPAGLEGRSGDVSSRARARGRQGRGIQRRFAEARDGFAAAAKLESGNDGVAAITGGTLRRLRGPAARETSARPRGRRPTTTTRMLWKQQGADIEKMPVHFKGEAPGRADAVGAADRPQRRVRAVPRQDADDAGRHAVRGDGEAVEGGSRERRDDQPHVQELPQPRTALESAGCPREMSRARCR